MVTNTVACTYSQCCYSVVINEEIAWRLVHQTIRLSLHLTEGMYYKFKLFGGSNEVIRVGNVCTLDQSVLGSFPIHNTNL